MNVAQKVLVYLAAYLLWGLIAIIADDAALRGQDAAGRGMYSGVTMFFMITAASLVMGIPAVRLTKQAKEEVHRGIRAAAWFILLAPALLIGCYIVLGLFLVVFG